jgi:hypothetical protein
MVMELATTVVKIRKQCPISPTVIEWTRRTSTFHIV